MKIGVSSFKGEMPRVSSRLLPDNYAGSATNARILSGDLTAWKQPTSIATLTPTNIKSIFKLQTALAGNDVFLRSADDVNWVKGSVSGDIAETILFTGFRDNPSGATTPARPKITNFAKATGAGIHTGQTAGNYPNDWLLLGVPTPVTTPTISQSVSTSLVLSTLSDGSSLSGFTSVATLTGQTVVVDAGVGNPASSIKTTSPFSATNTTPASFRQSVKFGNSIVHELNADFSFEVTTGQTEALIGFATDDLGNGFYLNANESNTSLTLKLIEGNFYTSPAVTSTTLATITLGAALTSAVFYTAKIRMFRTADNTAPYSIYVELFNGASSLGSTTVTHGSLYGQFISFASYASVTGASAGNVYWDNIKTYASSSAKDAEGELTSYVYTWKNTLGNESAPSPASSGTVYKHTDLTTTISNITDPSAGDITDYGLAATALGTKVLYRAATTASGSTAFFYVKDVAYATTSTTDTVATSALGEELESTDWALPPTDGHSIVSLPNGLTAMASKNQIFISERNRPHTYPLKYALTCDFDIVGFGAIDSTIIVLTKANPYIVVGSEPSNLSMAKLEIPYGCSSKRSIAHLKGFGVIYATANGLASINGSGVNLITDQFFTREQWQALTPSSINGFVHNDRYFFFFDS